MSKKIWIGIVITALALVAAACSQSNDANVNSNANNTASTTVTTTGPDNSEITTTTDRNGVKTETRTFKSNPRVSRVVVTTRNGTRTAKAYGPNGEEKEVSDPDVLHATGDAIADSAGWVKDKSITACCCRLPGCPTGLTRAQVPKRRGKQRGWLPSAILSPAR